MLTTFAQVSAQVPIPTLSLTLHDPKATAGVQRLMGEPCTSSEVIKKVRGQRSLLSVRFNRGQVSQKFPTATLVNPDSFRLNTVCCGLV